MDVMAIRGIRAYGKHGANPGERDNEQPFEIDVEIELDFSLAARSDDLDDTVNYAQIAQRVVDVVRTTSFHLLERLAREILDAIFADSRIHRASVCIGKPRILRGATPSVTLARRRGATG